GRYFSTAQVGYYTQANKIKQLPVQNVSSTLARVTFPVLSEIQDDNQRLKRGYKKILRQIFLIISPLMIGGIVLAEPLFRFALTDKWLPAVPYFQWLCVSGLFYPANSYNLNILKVKGRSDLVLYLGLVKKIGIIVGLLIFVHYSVLAIVIFRAFFSVVAFFINSYYSGKFINYSVSEQLIDIWKFLFLAAGMGLAIWIVSMVTNTTDLVTLINGIVVGGAVYGIFIFLFERSLLKETYQLLRKVI